MTHCMGREWHVLKCLFLALIFRFSISRISCPSSIRHPLPNRWENKFLLRILVEIYFELSVIDLKLSERSKTQKRSKNTSDLWLPTFCLCSFITSAIQNQKWDAQSREREELLFTAFHVASNCTETYITRFSILPSSRWSSSCKWAGWESGLERI